MYILEDTINKENNLLKDTENYYNTVNKKTK